MGLIVVAILTAGYTNAIVVSPAWMEFSGNTGEWVMKNITITNDEDKTVNVTIEPSSSISNCYVSNPKIVLAPNESVNISVGIQITKSAYGFLSYTADGEQFSQFILLTPSGRNVTVDMIPASPQAGGTVVFMLTPYNTRGIGFIYVTGTNHIYNFTIINGLAFVSLAKNEHGMAVAVFQGDDFQTRMVFQIGGGTPLTITAPDSVNSGDKINIHVEYNGNPVECNVNVTQPDGNEYIKSTDSNGDMSIVAGISGKWKFTVNYKGNTVSKEVNVTGSSGNLIIAVPSDITAGEEKTISVISGFSPAANAHVMVQYPDGTVKLFNADSNGQLKFNFTSAGIYEITASYGGATATKTVDASKKELNINIPSQGFVNTPLTIPAPEGAKVVIENGNKINGRATSNGYTFTPTSPGDYAIHVETSDGYADGTIKIFLTPQIYVYDSNNNPVMQGEAGKTYRIFVSDGSGNPVSLAYTTISDSMGRQTQISLNNGYGTWIPDKGGQYTIETPKTGNYYNAMKMIMIQNPSAGGYAWVGITAVILLLVAAIVVKYRHKIFGVMRKEEEEEEEEVE